MDVDLNGQNTVTDPTHMKGTSLYNEDNRHHASRITCLLTLESVDQGTRPYQFGDFIQGILSCGKRAQDKDDSPLYQFGDFTQGLFS
jgi:hypothetical protein